MADKLTTRGYWEDYYKHNHADRNHITNTGSRFDSYWDAMVSGKPDASSIIEIGGYPGRYLAYLADKYNLEPTCLDFNSDEMQLQQAFAAMNVTNYHLINKDFVKYKPSVAYDFVFSIGFVEHFDDFNSILDKHVDYLKPGGRMLILVPNKRFLRKIYGRLVDYDNLKAHNLKCMSIRTFRDFGNRNNLTIKRLEYWGGFPFGVHQKLNKFQNLIFKGTRQIFKFGLNPYIEKYPSKYFSESIIGVFEKPV